MALNLEHHVRLAKNGNKQALETVVEHIQEKIYGLALRMLGNNKDAEDETQEILIKIITHLGTFREACAFTSWVYRVAVNHLLTTRKQQNERDGLSFGILEGMLSADAGQPYAATVSGPERAFLAEEARLACMQTVLACLDRKTRIVYILGEIFGITSQEGAYIIDITPETFRKRLSRGRKCLAEFMLKHCGLVNEKNPCRCHKQAGKNRTSISSPSAMGPVVKRDGIVKGRAEAMAHLKELSEIERTAAMFRRYPEYQTPESFKYIIKDLIQSGRYNVFME